MPLKMSNHDRLILAAERDEAWFMTIETLDEKNQIGLAVGVSFDEDGNIAVSPLKSHKYVTGKIIFIRLQNQPLEK